MIINRYLWSRQTELVSLFKDLKNLPPDYISFHDWHLSDKYVQHNNSSYQVNIDYHQIFLPVYLKKYNKWTFMRQGSVGGRPYLKTSTDTSSFEPSPTWPIKIHIILIITRSGKSITSSFAHFWHRIINWWSNKTISRSLHIFLKLFTLKLIYLAVIQN